MDVLVQTAEQGRAALGAATLVLHDAYGLLPGIQAGSGIAGQRTVWETALDTDTNVREELRRNLDRVNAYAGKTYKGLPASGPLSTVDRKRVAEAVREARSWLVEAQRLHSPFTALVSRFDLGVNEAVGHATAAAAKVAKGAARAVKAKVGEGLDALKGVGSWLTVALALGAVLVVGGLVLVAKAKA